MGSPLNPIVSGLLGGFQLAHQMKGEQLAQQEFSEQKKRDEENAQVRDLATQMSLSDRGYKPSTPDQDAELMTGRGIGPVDVPGIVGGIQGPVASDIKARTAKFKGQNYVREPDAVREGKARKLRTEVRDDKIAEERAGAEAKGEAETGVLKRRMDLLGVPLTDEAATKYGVPKGTKLLQGPGFGTELGALMRGANQNAPDANDPVTHTYLTRENGGNVVSIHKSGKVRVSDALGLPADDKRKPGDLTAWQKYEKDRNDKKDAADAEAKRIKAQNDAQTQVNKLNKEEQLLHAENREIGARLLAGSAGTATDKKGKKVAVSATDAESLKARLLDNQNKVKMLQDQQHGIISRFAAPAAPATSKTNPLGLPGIE